MPELFFPQLSTGTLAQFPVKRITSLRTVSTEAEDGSRVAYFDSGATKLTWELAYTGLSLDEVNQIQQLFDACCGPLRAFTFLDPVANLLTTEWQATPGVQTSGLIFSNDSVTTGEVFQTLPVPASYTYCFSVWQTVPHDPTATVTLIRRGLQAEQRDTQELNRGVLLSSGQLADTSTSFTVAVQLEPGQSIDLSQAQLEAQPGVSPFRPATGGIYRKAHWAVDELTFVAEGIDAFQTTFKIETAV